jgi:hypothetical protein
MTTPTDLDRAVEREIVTEWLAMADEPPNAFGGTIRYVPICRQVPICATELEAIRTILTALSAEREAREVLEALAPTQPSTGHQTERMKGEGTP